MSILAILGSLLLGSVFGGLATRRRSKVIFYIFFFAPFAFVVLLFSFIFPFLEHFLLVFAFFDIFWLLEFYYFTLKCGFYPSERERAKYI